MPSHDIDREMDRVAKAALAEMLLTPRHGEVARLIKGGLDFSVVEALDRLSSRGLLTRTEASSGGFTDRTWIVYRTTAAGRTLGKRLLAEAEKEGGDADS